VPRPSLDLVQGKEKDQDQREKEKKMPLGSSKCSGERGYRDYVEKGGSQGFKRNQKRKENEQQTGRGGGKGLSKKNKLVGRGKEFRFQTPQRRNSLDQKGERSAKKGGSAPKEKKSGENMARKEKLLTSVCAKKRLLY